MHDVSSAGDARRLPRAPAQGGRVRRLVVALLLAAGPLAAQDYRLRLDARLQSVSFRGVALDSILAGAAVADSTGSLYTPDGFAVLCLPGEAYCTYFRPGA